MYTELTCVAHFASVGTLFSTQITTRWAEAKTEAEMVQILTPVLPCLCAKAAGGAEHSAYDLQARQYPHHT